MFSGIGQKTNLFARFSTVGGEKGSSDSARDPRGMSIKFYTKEGNWDWVFNNTPVFFIRDPALFPVFIHTQKRNPRTNLKDASYFWDYLSSHQESIHQVMYTFSDRGTPYSYRHMNAYSGHTFKFTKDDGSFKYVQIHIKTDQGIKNLTNEEAATMHSTNPDWQTQDLFEAIEKGEHPSWTVYIQVLDPADAQNYRWNIFDLTKVWPHKDVPLRPVGKIVLNRNVSFTTDIDPAWLTKILIFLSISPITTLPKSNSQPSLPRTWFQVLNHPPIQFCKPVYSPILTANVTVLASTINKFPSTTRW